MSEEKIILDTSDEAATFTTVKGWVSRNGIFFGENESTARYDGCTHRTCECGKVTHKSWLKCEECRNKADRERWEAMPRAEWGDFPVTIYRSDEYFWCEDEVYEYLHDNDLRPEDVMLVTCEPNYAREIDGSYWEDDLPEDGELPEAIATALDALNKVIREHKEPLSWIGGKKKVITPALKSEAA